MREATEREIPDMSLELTQMLSYADFLRETVGNLPPGDPGQFRLSEAQAEAFGWMLGDLGNFLHNLGEALYPGLDRTEKKGKSVAEPANNKTNGGLCIVEIEEVTDKLAVLCGALAHEADKVGTAAETPLDHSSAQGMLMLALEAHVKLHEQVYGMTPAEMATKSRG